MNHALKMPPGPKGLPVIGYLYQLYRLVNDPLPFVLEMENRFGSFAYLGKHRGKRVYLCTEPEYVKKILVEKHRNYPRMVNNKILEPLLGNGLLSSFGEFWLSQRRLMQPAFHRRLLNSMMQSMVSTIIDTIEQWNKIAEKNEPVNIAKEMSILTVQMICNIMFSVDIRSEAEKIEAAIKVVLPYLYQREINPLVLPEAIPTPRNRLYKNALSTLHKVTEAIIEERFQTQVDKGDLLSMLILARDEHTGEGMNRKQLHDEVITTLFAGHETTANMLTWIWLLLDENPAIEKKFQKENDNILNGRMPQYLELSRLTYAEMIINESMRMFPPVWITSRHCLANDEIDHYLIPANSTVIISPYVLHRHPRHWKNPEQFDPERFSTERSKTRHPFTFIPFSAGQHLCIGKHIALLEAKLILTLFSQKFKIKFSPSQKIAPEPVITLRPRGKVMATIEKRL